MKSRSKKKKNKLLLSNQHCLLAETELMAKDCDEIKDGSALSYI